MDSNLFIMTGNGADANVLAEFETINYPDFISSLMHGSMSLNYAV